MDKPVYLTEQFPNEYFCKTCGQLRINLRLEQPPVCRNCLSADIIVDYVGSEYLAQLRYRPNDKTEPDGSDTYDTTPNK